ncbi:MAG: hypothetical protein HY719_07870 [Planctomycetes bacterium]|nr:hypothetical protein [Planctomycetota bacterium]
MTSKRKINAPGKARDRRPAPARGRGNLGAPRGVIAAKPAGRRRASPYDAFFRLAGKNGVDPAAYHELRSLTRGRRSAD